MEKGDWGSMTEADLNLYNNFKQTNNSHCIKESNQGIQKLPYLANTSGDNRSKRPTCAPPILPARHHIDICV